MSARIAGRRQVWVGLALGLGLVGPLGCREPHDIAPVAPPGVKYERAAVGPQTEAQAIGETGPSNSMPAPNIDLTKALKSPPTAVGVATKTASGLEYVTLKEGTGPTVEPGQTALIQYTGTLADGKVFDSSRGKGDGFETQLGVGNVIKGWDEGVPGMKVGEVRKLVVPPSIGYGARGNPPVIPGNATLTFEVELISIK